MSHLTHFNVAILLTSLVQLVEAQTDTNPTRVDIFTTSSIAATLTTAYGLGLADTDIHLHRLDGIEILEAHLSDDLGVDPDIAKRRALQRLKQLDSEHNELLKSSATSIGLAVSYGVTRYPAVVIDARWVLYGISDIMRALEIFRLWQRRQSR